MKPSLVSPILEKLADRVGVSVHLEPVYRYAGQVQLPNGKKRYFLNTNFDINPLGASEIARDKAYAAYFLARLGYSVVEGASFFTPFWCRTIGSRRNPKAAFRYARTLGLPVFVKPNALSQGAGVCKVHNKREFMQAVRAIADRRARVFVVQSPAVGQDFRLVVLDDDVISAYERIPLSVVGDGRSSIAGLLRDKQEAFKRSGRDTLVSQRDFRIDNRLRRAGLSRRSVPLAGQAVALLDNANLSSGGDAIDVTSEIHGSYRDLAVRVARDMNLRYCGVDMIIDGDVRRPCERYCILEINAAPGLDHYAKIGRKQRALVENLYLRVLRAMAS